MYDSENFQQFYFKYQTEVMPRGESLQSFCVIDNQAVWDGSYNWTNNAETKNNEEVVIHKNALELASSYTKEFNRI